jgi:hypothetical protein
MAGKLNPKKAKAAPQQQAAYKNDSEPKLEWMVINEAAFDTQNVKGPHNAWKKAQELAKEKQYEFEDAFVAEAKKRGTVPDGKTLSFGYRFGNIAVAIVDDDGKPRGAKKERKTFSL